MKKACALILRLQACKSFLLFHDLVKVLSDEVPSQKASIDM